MTASVIPLMRNADSLYRLASSIDQQEPTRAEIMYRAVLVSHPGHSLAMVNLGNLEFRKGEFDLAKALYQKALAVDPECPEAAYNLGYMALEEKEYSDAVSLLETATRLDPGFKDAWINLAIAYSKLRHLSKARYAQQRAMELAK